MISDPRATDVLIWEEEMVSEIVEQAEEYLRFWKRNEYPLLVSQMSEDVPKEFVTVAKREYLKTKIEEELEYLKRADNHFKFLMRMELEGSLIEAIMEGWWDWEVHDKACRGYKVRLHFLQKGDTSKLSDEMVNAAKNFPIDEILDFDARGFTVCPYHDEKTPSFSIWRKKNIGHCFGCGSSADGIKLLMDIEKLSFPEAVKKLASY